MDFAQNYAVPSIPETPSQWYFMSLLNVSVFGVSVAHQNCQYNFVYSENKGGKGANEVISMLNRVVAAEEYQGTARKLTIYADNCSGQNKNNFVIKFCLLLTHLGTFSEVNLKFLVKGHTKNACDRSFGVLKRHMMRQTCWTVTQLHDAMKTASTTIKTKLLDSETTPGFYDYKAVLNEVYKNLKGIKKYQLFRMRKSRPGIVECRVRPSDLQEEFDLRKRYMGEFVSPMSVGRVYEGIASIPDPPKNTEKLFDTYTKIRPQVPSQFLDDELYVAPSAEDVAQAKLIKRARRELRASASETVGSGSAP